MESLEIARLLHEAFPREVLDIREHRGQVAVLLRHRNDGHRRVNARP